MFCTIVVVQSLHVLINLNLLYTVARATIVRLHVLMCDVTGFISVKCLMIVYVGCGDLHLGSLRPFPSLPHAWVPSPLFEVSSWCVRRNHQQSYSIEQDMIVVYKEGLIVFRVSLLTLAMPAYKLHTYRLVKITFLLHTWVLLLVPFGISLTASRII